MYLCRHMKETYSLKTKKRIAYIDTAKTICIFLMIVGHWTSNDILNRYIYSFHMPALFIISGFLYKPKSWVETILSFGIPITFYSLINLCVLIFTNEISMSSIFSKELFFRLFHYRYGLGDGLYRGDWFIWALLGLRLLYGDIDQLKKIKKYYIVISCCALLYMSLQTYFISINALFRGWYIGLLIPSMPFFCLGFFLKDKQWKPYHQPYYILALLSISFISIPLINGFCSINSNSYGLSYSLFFINAVASSLLLFIISSYIPSTTFCTIISKGTLLILGLHIPIMHILDSILPNCFDHIIPIITLLLCYYPILWLDNWCPLLLGKINK